MGNPAGLSVTRAEEITRELISMRIERCLSEIGGRLSLPKLCGMILLRDGFICHYCGTTEAQMTVDHKIPISCGGDDSPENLVCCCHSCNRKKANKPYNGSVSVCNSLNRHRFWNPEPSSIFYSHFNSCTLPHFPVLRGSWI